MMKNLLNSGKTNPNSRKETVLGLFLIPLKTNVYILIFLFHAITSISFSQSSNLYQRDFDKNKSFENKANGLIENLNEFENSLIQESVKKNEYLNSDDAVKIDHYKEKINVISEELKEKCPNFDMQNLFKHEFQFQQITKWIELFPSEYNNLIIFLKDKN